jgi:hypothetical protein
MNKFLARGLHHKHSGFGSKQSATELKSLSKCGMPRAEEKGPCGAAQSYSPALLRDLQQRKTSFVERADLKTTTTWLSTA